MSKIIKRISFDSINFTDLSGTNPSDPENPDVNPEIPALPELHPAYEFQKTTLPGYGSALPVTDVDFSFPAEDLKRVQAWFSGDFSHVTEPESSTLKKNMRAAVISALNSFFSAAEYRNLFTAPFRIGYRYRLFDNSTVEVATPQILIPIATAPYMIITSHKIYEKALHTEVTFSQFPGRLMFAIQPDEDLLRFSDIITSVEFYISRPQKLFPDDAGVAGIRTVTIDDARQRVWQYDSYEADAILNAAKNDSNFRIIASIPFSSIAGGEYSSISPFPIEAGALQNFSSQPKKISSQGWRPYLHIESEPLHLDLPENTKVVTDLFLRGVFQRNEVKLTLYGSSHRRNWNLIARADGPFIRGIRRARFRWFKVEIETPMQPNDFIDALTFRFLPGPSHAWR